MKLRFVLLLVLPMVVIGIGAVTLLLTTSPSRSSHTITITVEEGDTLFDVSNTLYAKHLLRHPLVAITLGKVLYHLTEVKGGDYVFSENENTLSIVRKLAVGAPQRELRIVIPEGWTTREIGAYLEGRGLFSQEEFTAALQGDWHTKYPFLPEYVSTQNLEGYLFPDTYRVFAQATPEDVIKKMLDTFDVRFGEKYRERAHELGISLHDTVTLASIIEREVRSDEDRAKVADIFFRRMKNGMPLQADSTVNYVTGKHTLKVTIDDTTTSSPYNTYRVKGLPPGAIDNPGLSALRAVLYPMPNEFVYFLTTPDGKTIFSKSFEEHVKNKIRYLK